MAIQGFDKLNLVERHSLSYREYFGNMELTTKQKKDRIDLAYILEDFMLTLFDIFMVSEKIGQRNDTKIKQELTYELYEIVSDKGFFRTEEELDKYVRETVSNVYKSTVDNMQKYPDDVVAKDNVSEEQLQREEEIPTDKVEPYWVSADRARYVAENEANTLYNSKDYVDAIKEGKTRKVWVSYGDERVRKTHIEIDGDVIPIDALFNVGDALMLYPKDTTSPDSTGDLHPEEVINCRCQAYYY